MHTAEIAIRKDIESLTKYRMGPITQDIKKDIKYALWHGFINEKIYNQLLDDLEEKRNSLFE